jgi:phosphoglucosamine mutase
VLPRFGTDGVRGVANAELTPEIATALARAAAEVLGGDRVVIGRDTRRSGPLLEAALVAGFCASGLDVTLLGVVPTPAVAWAAARDGVPGVVISASHNPFADNGIKLFAAGGAKLGDTAEAAIEARFHALLQQSPAAGLDRIGSAPPTGAAVGTVSTTTSSAGTSAQGWADAVVASAGVRFDGLRVVVDAANGAAAAFAGPIFERLGADVSVIADQPDGVNINRDCGSTHPEALAEVVVAGGADLGLALDGDADRLLAVDGAGRVVDGDHILAILAADLRRRGALNRDTVVVTVMTNLGFRRAMAQRGIAVVDTPVGDRHVLQAIEAGGYSLGGEQSGHVILRDLAATGDGLLTAVALTAAVVRADASLAELAAAAMTSVPQVLRNVRVPRRDPALLDRVAPAVVAAEQRLGADGRVLLRPSGTEPLVRVMVEAIDAAVADAVCDELVAAVERAAADGGPNGSRVDTA